MFVFSVCLSFHYQTGLSCNFETDLCGWYQDQMDSYDWSVQTGSDHTIGTGMKNICFSNNFLGNKCCSRTSGTALKLLYMLYYTTETFKVGNPISAGITVDITDYKPRNLNCPVQMERHIIL